MRTVPKLQGRTGAFACGVAAQAENNAEAPVELGPSRSPVLSWVLFLAASLVNLLLLWHFHDRYWYPTDDGFHAHVAQRFSSGEVLNLDVQDIHPGYIHFLHAAAFRLFGLDMVSLRYPLILAAFLQTGFVYALLQRRDIALAVFGSIAITARGGIH